MNQKISNILNVVLTVSLILALLSLWSVQKKVDTLNKEAHYWKGVSSKSYAGLLMATSPVDKNGNTFGIHGFWTSRCRQG